MAISGYWCWLTGPGLWIMLYQRPWGSSTPGKSVLPHQQLNVLAYYTGSNHEYTHSKPTAMANNAHWLHLDTFTTMGDALSQTRRLLNTRKKRFCHEGKSMFWQFFWIKPWIHTFWAHCSGIQCQLVPTRYLSTRGICYTTDHKALQHLENQYCLAHQSIFWPFPVDHTMIDCTYSEFTVVAQSPDSLHLDSEHLSTHGTCSTTTRRIRNTSKMVLL